MNTKYFFSYKDINYQQMLHFHDKCFPEIQTRISIFNWSSTQEYA